MCELLHAVEERITVTVLLERRACSFDQGGEHGESELEGEVELWQMHHLVEELFELGPVDTGKVLDTAGAQARRASLERRRQRRGALGQAAALRLLRAPARTRIVASHLGHGRLLRRGQSDRRKGVRRRGGWPVTRTNGPPVIGSARSYQIKDAGRSMWSNGWLVLAVSLWLLGEMMALGAAAQAIINRARLADVSRKFPLVSPGTLNLVHGSDLGFDEGPWDLVLDENRRQWGREARRAEPGGLSRPDRPSFPGRHHLSALGGPPVARRKPVPVPRRTPLQWVGAEERTCRELS